MHVSTSTFFVCLCLFRAAFLGFQLVLWQSTHVDECSSGSHFIQPYHVAWERKSRWPAAESAQHDPYASWPVRSCRRELCLTHESQAPQEASPFHALISNEKEGTTAGHQPTPRHTRLRFPPPRGLLTRGVIQPLDMSRGILLEISKNILGAHLIDPVNVDGVQS